MDRLAVLEPKVIWLQCNLVTFPWSRLFEYLPRGFEKRVNHLREEMGWGITQSGLLLGCVSGVRWLKSLDFSLSPCLGKCVCYI